MGYSLYVWDENGTEESVFVISFIVQNIYDTFFTSKQ